MNQPTVERVHWTIADLELLPDNGTRYEIIDGELFMTRAPRWSHQQVADNICAELNRWSRETGLGRAVTTPGIIFSDANNVIPDLAWASHDRLSQLLDEAEHLTGAPELIGEVLSPGANSERRPQICRDDSERSEAEALCIVATASGCAGEYWIPFTRSKDPTLQQVQVYRRQRYSHSKKLALSATVASW